MIRRNTWILLAVFAVLLVALVYLQRSGGLGANEEEVTPAVEEQKLLDVDAERIQSFRIEDAQDRSVAVERDGQGAWTMTDPQAEGADSARVDSALASLASLGVLNTLETDLDLEIIGLSEPAYILEIGLADGNQHVIQIGAATPTGTGYYARMDGGTPVVVSKFTIDSVAELLTTPPVLNTPAPTP